MPTLFSKEKLFLPMNLQLFADPEDVEESTSGEETTSTDSKSNEETAKHFLVMN